MRRTTPEDQTSAPRPCFIDGVAYHRCYGCGVRVAIIDQPDHAALCKQKARIDARTRPVRGTG